MTLATQKRQSVDTESDSGTGHHRARSRFFDSANAAWMVKVFPGEFQMSSAPDELLVTVLGSCVSACIRDPRTGMGGMNHFMLPGGDDGKWGSNVQSMRYGNVAMEKLINELLKAGCARERLEIKVFGGGNVTDSSTLVGTRNAEYVLRYLEAEGLSCAVQDLGGQFPRRIHYSTKTGRVTRRLLGRGDADAIVREEIDYAKQLGSRKTSGEIELFGE